MQETEDIKMSQAYSVQLIFLKRQNHSR